MAGATPLPTGTEKGLGGAVLLITHIPAVIVPITEPLSVDAVSVVTQEMRRRAGLEHTAVVLIRTLDAVWVPITFPAPWDAETICLALKFIWVAHTRRPGLTVFLIRVVIAVKNTITMICVANTLILTGTFELRRSAINYTTILIGSINTVFVPITDIKYVNTPMVSAVKLTR